MLLLALVIGVFHPCWSSKKQHTERRSWCNEPVEVSPTVLLETDEELLEFLTLSEISYNSVAGEKHQQQRKNIFIGDVLSYSQPYGGNSSDLMCSETIRKIKTVGVYTETSSTYQLHKNCHTCK